MNELKDILERGIEGPFWAWFQDRVLDEWGPNGKRYLAELDKALNLTDNDAAASQARQVRSGQKAILSLLRLPYDEIRRQGESEPMVVAPGRPAMDPELVGLGRRGSL